jgi:quercetin dioxygenase-like cupin family protein
MGDAAGRTPIPTVTSCVTLCVPEVAPYGIETPTAEFPVPAPWTGGAALAPTAPVFVNWVGPAADAAETVEQGYDFELGGAQFQLLAGALNTDYRIEAARVTLVPGGMLAPVCTQRDIMIVGIAGLAVASVNGAARPVGPGAFLYVHAGSVWSVAHAPPDDPTPATVTLIFVGAGPLGFYRAAASIVADNRPASAEANVLSSSAAQPSVSPAQDVVARLATVARSYGVILH